jgi:hypothetical protein
MASQNKAAVCAILFRAAAETLRLIAADPRHLGAEIGGVAVLHGWGQAMQHHPHLHRIVPGGGLSPDRTRWIACRPGFFLPIKGLGRLFRRLFLERLAAAFADGALRFFGGLAPLAEPDAFAAHCAALRRIDWVVCAKPPFGGPEQVLAHLGRYTHRVAIANSRLITLTDDAVGFRWKDYRQEGRPKVMTLDPARVHPPVPPARPAARLPSHPPLRLPRQQPPCCPARAPPPIAGAACRRSAGLSAPLSPTATGAPRHGRTARSLAAVPAAAASR